MLPVSTPLAAPTFHQWVTYKTKPTQFGDNKNAPGIDYSVSECPQCHGKMTYGERLAAGVCSACYYAEEPATTPSEPGAGDLDTTPAA